MSNHKCNLLAVSINTILRLTHSVVVIVMIMWIPKDADGQNSSEHSQAKKETTQAELRQWRSDYQKAVVSRDSVNIFDLALNLRQYHKGQFDSTYYYNEALINTAVHVDNIEVYIDAQKDNHFMDNQMYQKAEKARERVRAIKPYLKYSNLSLSSKFDIATMQASHFQQMGDLDSTIFYQRMAVDYSDSIGLDHLPKVSANLGLAIFLDLVGKSAEAIEYLTGIEGTIDSERYPAIQRIRFYEAMGKSLIAIGDPSDAQRYSDKVKALVESNNYATFYHNYHTLNGRIASAQGRPETAIQHFDQALQNLKKGSLQVYKPGIWSNLAHQYANLGNLPEMKRYMDSLLINFDKLNGRNKMHYHGHAVNYYLQIDDENRAKASLDYINAYNTKPTPERLSIARLNALFYEKTGNTAMELVAVKKYTALKDSLDLIADGAIARRISAEYEREKQELEISTLTQTTAAQDKALAIRNTALLIGGLMLLILAVLLYLLYKLYQQNQEQTVKITKALEDNQILIKEIHHRVNNNLQVVSSLLSLQERKVDDEATKEALRSSQTRVQTMSLIHKNLYQKDDVRNVNVQTYFQTLTENLIATFAIHPTKLNVDIDKINIDIDSLVPLGLIANELICNALKHGLKDKSDGLLNVSLKDQGDLIVLTVEDNGGKFLGDKLILKEGSLGTRLIKSLANNLEGEITVSGGNTTKVSLTVDKIKVSQIMK